MTKDALLEIGSEELPASFIPLGMRQLKSLSETSLAESKISFGSVTVYGTPRRLAVVIHDLAERSQDQEKVLLGPPQKIAQDEHGHWTPAALGFARKQGIPPKNLILENGKVKASLSIKGTTATALLAELFPGWIQKLEFPKSMVWEPSQFRYPRPLRWINALYGTTPVSFTLAGVKAGRFTFGLYLQSAKKIQVPSAGKYALFLKNHCVLVDPEERQECIRRLAEHAVKRIHGRALLSEALLSQVANLVEHPAAIVGHFDPAYLELPQEVLITCLEHHQKYFPVVSPHPFPLPRTAGEGGADRRDAEGEGTLLPYFIGIRNGMSLHQEVVREGYERVLAARLADAKFFYQQDRKTPLAAKVEALKGVMFQQKLGSVFDKQERMKRLIGEWAAPAGLSTEEKSVALRAAELGKADLVTDMVREFPELQGKMARLYALSDNENPAVAQAAEQHYWPITLTSALPETSAAALVALADKLDTLAGDFAVGLIPTGSADPYGLRRAAVGVLRILEARAWSFELEALIQAAIAVQPAGVVSNGAEVQTKLELFFKQRWAALLLEREFKPDEVEAVLATGMGAVPVNLARLEALHQVRQQKDFEPLAAAYKRAMNIVRQATKSGAWDGATPQVDDAKLQEPSEKTLYQALQEAQSRVRTGLDQGRHAEALSAIVPLREPLDAFFAAVMVMAEDPALRANRLALMQTVVNLFSPIADFSKLQNA